MSSKLKIHYHTRLWLWLLGYSWLMVGCFVAFQYHRERQFKAEALNARLQAYNALLLSRINAFEGTQLDSLLATEGTHTGDTTGLFKDLRISIIALDGKVLYDNSIDTLPFANHLQREEVVSALRSGEGYTIRRHSESTGQTYFYSAKQDGRHIVRTALPYSVSLLDMLSADRGTFYVMFAITLIMCLLGYILTRGLGRNVSRLSEFASKAEKGETIYDNAPFPDDELGEISGHIIRLYARLQSTMAQRDAQHKEAMFYQQEKVRIKKQLTSDINHELKTPLASIQACVETLIAHDDMSAEKRSEFLGRCEENCLRLKRLMNDVSLITRMDEGSQMIEKEPLDLSEIISTVCEDLRVRAEAQNVSLICNVDESLPLNGNASLLASVFHNLIDNALAYSGGTKIEVTLIRNDESSFILTLADNGCGVPPEHLPRLFERFYRVDKGRSRKAGGTGLGLSIVKNAVLIHGGTISVRNHPSGGLFFTLTFPKSKENAPIR